jgi:hypothetical protein
MMLAGRHPSGWDLSKLAVAGLAVPSPPSCQPGIERCRDAADEALQQQQQQLLAAVPAAYDAFGIMSGSCLIALAYRNVISPKIRAKLYNIRQEASHTPCAYRPACCRCFEGPTKQLAWPEMLPLGSDAAFYHRIAICAGLPARAGDPAGAEGTLLHIWTPSAPQATHGIAIGKQPFNS